MEQVARFERELPVNLHDYDGARNGIDINHSHCIGHTADNPDNLGVAGGQNNSLLSC